MVCLILVRQNAASRNERLSEIAGADGTRGNPRLVGIIFARMRQETWIGWMAWPRGFAHASFRDFTGAGGRCSAWFSQGTGRTKPGAEWRLPNCLI